MPKNYKSKHFVFYNSYASPIYEAIAGLKIVTDIMGLDVLSMFFTVLSNHRELKGLQLIYCVATLSSIYICSVKSHD